MIKGIVFDLDGVYFINGKENFINNLVSLGVNEDDVKKIFLKSDEMNNLYKTGKWNDKQFWQWALSQWGLDTNMDIVKTLIAGYQVNEPIVEIIKTIRKNGYKILICSNNFPARINGLEKRFGFLKDFDIVCVSYEVGKTKPSEKIFKELIKKSRLNANEIAYADDNQNNVLCAQKVGISAFLYDGFENFLKELRNIGVNTD